MANAIEEYRKKFGTKEIKAPSAIEQYRSLNKKTTQDVKSPTDLYREQQGFKPKTSSDDLKNSQGLYNLASQNGLKDKADKIMSDTSGEETKKIFSGGFISDIFDTVSALQYGVTGLLKGKTFSEGVKTRQSFSDKDSLGANGIPGLIAGIAMDIAVDPLTYIAPWTVFKKIPGALKAANAIKELAVGKMVTKTIKGTDKTRETLEGGTRLGRTLAQKFTWMFGADPMFKETYERGLKNTAVSTQAVADMGKAVANLAPETAIKLLKKDKTGRFARVGLAELEKIIKPEEFESVAALYNKIDSLSLRTKGVTCA